LIEKGKIRLSKSISKKITYHDPCYLSRFERIREEPRKVLRSIPKVHLVEMFRNKLNTWCCGGGITVYNTFPELSEEIAETRLQEAKQVKAELLVTSCPHCVTVLAPVANKLNLEIRDLALVVEEAL